MMTVVDWYFGDKTLMNLDLDGQFEPHKHTKLLCHEVDLIVQFRWLNNWILVQVGVKLLAMDSWASDKTRYNQTGGDGSIPGLA